MASQQRSSSDILDPVKLLDRLPKDRTVPLLALVAGLVLTGVMLRGVGGNARKPAPCNAPFLVDGELRCDGDGEGGRDGEGIGARAWLLGKPLDLNRATRAELEQLPGVGPGLAAAILEARDAKRGFRSVEELDDVRGVGPKTLARIRPWVVVRP